MLSHCRSTLAGPTRCERILPTLASRSGWFTQFENENPGVVVRAGVNLPMCTKSDFAHVGGLWAFRAFYDFKLHPITLSQGTESFAFDRGVVDEYVLSTLLRDEAEPLAVVEPLDGTFRHDPLPLLTWDETASHVRWPQWPVKQAELF